MTMSDDGGYIEEEDGQVERRERGEH